MAKFRDQVAKIEYEASLLRTENEAIKTKLRGAGVDISLWALSQARELVEGVSGLDSQLVDHVQREEALKQTDAYYVDPLLLDMSSQNMQAFDEQQWSEMFGDIDIDNLTVALSMDETMGTPCLNISSNSSAQSLVAGPKDCEILLTPAQEQTAINFILA